MCNRIWPGFISGIYFLNKTGGKYKGRRLTTFDYNSICWNEISTEKKIYRFTFLVSPENSFQRVLLLAGWLVAAAASHPNQRLTSGRRREENLWCELWSGSSSSSCSSSCLVYRMVHHSRLGQSPRLVSPASHHGWSGELCILVSHFSLLDSKWKLYSGGNLRSFRKPKI